MLKRVSILAALTVLGVVLLAAGPPTEEELDGKEYPVGPIYFFGTIDSDAPQIHSPAPAADDIPPEIRVQLEANLPQADNGYSCALTEWAPRVEHHRRLKGQGRIDCIGDAVSQVKLAVAIQRHKHLIWWTNIAKNTSSWLNGKSAHTVMYGDCASGTHTYRTVVDGWARLTDGTVKSYSTTSSQVRTDCEL